MIFFQLVHTLTKGDAISGEVLVIDQVLKQNNKQSTIYYTVVHPELKGQGKTYLSLAQDIEQLCNQGEKVCLILHYSLSSPLNGIYLESNAFKKILVYHNLTPVKFYQSYNYRVYNDLIAGFKELPDLLKKTDTILSDSSFNKSEIDQYGSFDSKVLSLPIDKTKWEIAANPGIAQILQGSGKINLMHVGRIAPNKSLEDIIKIFYFYFHKINKKSHLWLIGGEVDNEIYAFELKALVRNLNLTDHVTFAGVTSDCELKSFYQNSHIYLCMSEHEGFCVPLIEAMHFNLPIIAYGSTAIPETLGDAGIIVNEKRHAEIAELVQIILEDKELKQQLITRGQKRLENFSQETFSRQLRESLLENLLEKLLDNPS